MESDKRETLLEVGNHFFSRYGYKDVNIQEISRAAGISTGSFYNYFPSKESFYGEILDRIEEQGIQEADRMVSRLDSPVNKLKALYRFTILGIKKNQIIRGILTRNEKYIYPGSESRQKRQSSLRTHIESMIADIIKDGSRRRIFRTGIFNDPRLMVTAIYNTILTNFEINEIEDLIHDILLLLERGLKRRPRLIKPEERKDRRNKRNLFLDDRF